MTDMPIRRYIIVAHPDALAGYWFDAFGWIAFGFSQLEGASYKIIQKLEAPAKRKGSMKLPYSARSARARDLIAAHVKHDPKLRSDWALFWKDAIAAAPMRNAIFHNPVNADWQAMETVTEQDGILNMQKPGQPIMKLGEIQAFSSHISELGRKMISLLSLSNLPA